MKRKITAILIVGLFALSCLIVPGVQAQQQMPPQLEIVVADITFSDAEPIEGDTITVSITVSSNESVAIDNITVSVYSGYSLIENITDVSIDANGTVTKSFEWETTSGTHNLSAMAYVADMPLKDSVGSQEITIALGDVGTVVIALITLLVIILCIAVIPSIAGKMKR